MSSIQKYKFKRSLLIMNGRMYRHWSGNIPRRALHRPWPIDGPTVFVESDPDGPVSVVVRDRGIPTKFVFGGDDIKLSVSKSGRLIVEVVGRPSEVSPDPTMANFGPSPFNL